MAGGVSAPLAGAGQRVTMEFRPQVVESELPVGVEKWVREVFAREGWDFDQWHRVPYWRSALVCAAASEGVRRRTEEEQMSRTRALEDIANSYGLDPSTLRVMFWRTAGQAGKTLQTVADKAG